MISSKIETRVHPLYSWLEKLSFSHLYKYMFSSYIQICLIYNKLIIVIRSIL